jgi:hypothetical protein
MIIICGRTIAEVEHDLEMAKAAIATGAPMGIGGATMADVEQALRGLRQAVGCEISNPNYVGVPPIEDEICPECGADWDGDFCEVCGYDLCDCDCECDCCNCECECVDTELADEDEDEDEELSADNLDDLTAEDIDRITEQYGLPKVWAAVMKSVLGL